MTEGYIVLERGLTTIPLAGIDAPFHSRYIWSGVMPFCAYLSKKIPSTLLDSLLLEGIYIPNLIASPFAINKAYAELIYNHTLSPRLSKVLYKWDEEHWDAPEQWQKLSWVLLVELLSYQFASPMRWIETQDLFFGQYRFERFIEIGPSSTLTGMAVRTLKAKYEAMDDSTSVVRRVFCAPKHQKEIYYQFEDDLEVTSGQTQPVKQHLRHPLHYQVCQSQLLPLLRLPPVLLLRSKTLRSVLSTSLLRLSLKS
ncbi:hypothetical protein BGW80DRAFT_1232215 [Lactifluus volemus]|nr:hypothetical protein BGW80DRAFT_1232215 [Lactifluus volemus]